MAQAHAAPGAPARARLDALPSRIGGAVPVIGGIVFVAANAEHLGTPWPMILIPAIIALAAVALFFLFVRPRSLGPFVPPKTMSFRTYTIVVFVIYGLSVLAMIIAISQGRRLAAEAGMMHLEPAIIATFVGAHFFPFAWAFRVRMIVGLATVVTALGIIGILTGIAFGAPWAALCAVVAGFAQVTIVALWAAGKLWPNRAVA